MDIIIEQLQNEDSKSFLELVRIFASVFEMDGFVDPGEDHLLKILRSEHFGVFVARSGNRVVGGLTLHVLENYYEPKPAAYIYDVGIEKSFQRKGIGSQLMDAVMDYCRENGFKEAWVEAETDDIHAVNFYRKTKHSQLLNATHFIYNFE